jgi:hypothetical protein
MFNVNLVGHRKPKFVLFVSFVFKPPNPETLYGKVDTKLTFQKLLVIGLTE